MVSSSAVCCLPQLAAQWGGFPGALSAMAVACRHAAYALYNYRGCYSHRIQCALKWVACLSIRNLLFPQLRRLLPEDEP